MRDEKHTLRQDGELSIHNSESSQANMLQEITSYQDELAQDMNEQLAATMQANFTRGLMFYKSVLRRWKLFQLLLSSTLIASRMKVFSNFSKISNRKWKISLKRTRT